MIKKIMLKIKSKIFTGLMVALFALTAASFASAAWAPTSAKYITKSSSSVNVKWLQSTLNDVQNAMLVVDGLYGPKTTAAIVTFQKAHPAAGAADGIAGPMTIAALNAAGANGSMSTSTVPGCTSTTGFSPTTGQPCNSAVSNPTTTLPAGCTSTTGFSPLTGVSCATGVSTSTQTGPLAVQLSQDNPAAGNIISGQALADLAHFTFTGNGTLSQVTLKRTGLSVSADISNVYLYDGNHRLTDGASVNTAGDVVFNNVNIPINGSRNLSVRVDMNTGTSSVNLGMTLTSYMASGSTTPTTVNVAGNIFVVSSAPAGVTTATLQATTVSSGAVNAGTMNYTVWSNGLQVNGRAAMFKGLNLHYVGSAPYDSVQNLKLYVDGSQVGTSSGVDANGYAFFDLGAGVNLSVSTHTIEVRGDIMKGSNRNLQFSLQNASDLMLTDSQIGISINATNAVSNGAAGTIAVNAGSVTVTVDPSFNTTGTITGGATNVPIAQYKFAAYGEDMKISSLTVTPTVATGIVASGSATNLNNVALYANGGQIGSSANYTGTALVFTLGSSLIIPAGTTTVVTVKADTINDTNVNYTGGTITTKIAGSTNNAQGQSSQSLSTAPSTAGVTSGALTIGSASATVAVSTSLNAQNIIANTAKTKIGSFVIQAGATEGVRVSNLNIGLAFGSATNATYASGTVTTGSHQITVTGSTVNIGVGDVITIPGATAAVGTVTSVDSATTFTANFTTAGATPAGVITGTSGPMTITNISNLYTSDDTNNVIGNPAASNNNFSVNYTIPASTSRTIDVYADLGGLKAGTVQATLKVTAVGASTNVALTTGTGIATALSGQVMTVAAGSLATPTVTTNSLVSQFVLGGTSPALATYNFVATNGDATITQLIFTIATTPAAISQVCIGTVCAPVVSGTATVAGLNITIPAGYAGANVTVTPTFNKVGIGQQASNSIVQMNLTSMKYTIGNTVTTTAVTVTGEKNMSLVATKPTVTIAAPTGAILTTGSVETADVTVTADAAGSITLNSIPVVATISSSGAAAYFTNAGAVTMKDSNNVNVPLTAAACPATATNLTCSQTLTITNGYTIAAGTSQTFKIFFPIANLSTGTLPNTYVYTSLATGTGFSWGDVSGNNPTITDTTYMNTYPTNTASIHN
ncbi:MAG: peptidoglycan-binding protein [Patescibacteria group bacterium]|nr:peptidoglycan-binding protein [Patescibacteria group bacterium]